MPSDVTLTFDAKMAGAVQEYTRLLQQVEKVEGGQKKLARASADAARGIERDAGKANQGMKGLELSIAGVARQFATMASASAVLATISAHLREINERAKELAAAKPAEEIGLQKFATMAGSPVELAGYKAIARRLAESNGMPIDQAQAIVFQAYSQGLQGDILAAGRARDITPNPADLVMGAGKMRSAFGAGAAGNFNQIVAKFIAAANPSDVDPDTIARAASVAAQSVAGVGGSDAELLAMLSVFSPAFKSSDIAADRIKALATKLGRPIEFTKPGARKPTSVRLTSRGLLARIAEAEALVGGDLGQLLEGDVEAAAGYQQFKTDRALVGQRLAEVTRAGTTLDALTNAYRNVESDPDLQRLKLKRVADVRRDLAQGALAEDELRYQTGRAVFQRLLSEQQAARGERPYPSFRDNLSLWFADFLNMSVGGRAASEFLVSSGPTIRPAAGGAQAVVDAIERQTRQQRRWSGVGTLRSINADANEGESVDLAAPR